MYVWNTSGEAKASQIKYNKDPEAQISARHGAQHRKHQNFAEQRTCLLLAQEPVLKDFVLIIRAKVSTCIVF